MFEAQSNDVVQPTRCTIVVQKCATPVFNTRFCTGPKVCHISQRSFSTCSLEVFLLLFLKFLSHPASHSGKTFELLHMADNEEKEHVIIFLRINLRKF